jgi:hypothetical protein
MSELHRRWYDHDPLLIEVLEMLRSYPEELHAQARFFLNKLEEAIGTETFEPVIEALAEQHSEREVQGKTARWYDEDVTVYQAVELLRLSTPEIQRQAARKFLDALKQKTPQ